MSLAAGLPPRGSKEALSALMVEEVGEQGSDAGGGRGHGVDAAGHGQGRGAAPVAADAEEKEQPASALGEGEAPSIACLAIGKKMVTKR